MGNHKSLQAKHHLQHQTEAYDNNTTNLYMCKNEN